MTNQMHNNLDLYDLADELDQFAKDRDWEQFHSPKNLIMALSVEVAELAEHYQWLRDNECPRSSLNDRAEEAADILIYLVRFCSVEGIDLMTAAFDKVHKNARKYPADKVSGQAKKYSEYD